MIFKKASSSHNPLGPNFIFHEIMKDEIWQRPSYYCPKRVLFRQNLQLLWGPNYVQNEWSVAISNYIFFIKSV